MSDSLRPHGLQNTRLPCPSLFPRVCWNSCPLSQWCYPTLSPSITPFSHLQSFPASASFPMSRLFTLGGQSIGASASASVLSMNIQDWFPLGLTNLIYLLFMRLSGVFSRIWPPTQDMLASGHSNNFNGVGKNQPQRPYPGVTLLPFQAYVLAFFCSCWGWGGDCSTPLCGRKLLSWLPGRSLLT